LKSILQQIDHALASIYQINHQLKAADFVLSPQSNTKSGAILIHDPQEEPKTDSVEVGLIFNPAIHQELLTVSPDWFHLWTPEQHQAFSVVVEEVSHFRFFVFHAQAQRKMSQLELEFQGEVDKFLLFFFTLTQSRQDLAQSFDSLFSQVFENFSWVPHLSPEAQERYQAANQMAREYIQKNRTLFLSPGHFVELFTQLRKFYRLSPEERFSLTHRF